VLLRPQNRRPTPLSTAAGEGVGDEIPFEDRFEPGHQRMVQYTLPKRRRVDRSWFGIADLEAMEATHRHRAVENSRLQSIELSVELRGESPDLGTVRLPSEARQKAQARCSRSATSSR